MKFFSAYFDNHSQWMFVKYVSPLSEESVATLKEAMKNHARSSVRERARAILLSHKGFRVKDIAKIYDASRQTASNWIELWEKRGLAGLCDAPRSGRPSKLDREEKEVVKKLIDKFPRSPKAVLDGVSRQMKKSISRSTLKRISRGLGFSWKRIKKSLKSKRDEAAFRQAEKEIEALKARRKKGLIDLFYFDESGFSLTPSVPYARQPIGRHIEVPSASSERLNVLGFIDADNRFESYCFECSVDSDVVIACFNDFVGKPDKETVVLLDNASPHRSAAFKECIPEWEKQGLFPKFLPPYCPELNPIEILWRHIKYFWLDFSAYSSFVNLVDSVENILRNVGYQYRVNFA